MLKKNKVFYKYNFDYTSYKNIVYINRVGYARDFMSCEIAIQEHHNLKLNKSLLRNCFARTTFHFSNLQNFKNSF